MLQLEWRVNERDFDFRIHFALFLLNAETGLASQYIQQGVDATISQQEEVEISAGASSKEPASFRTTLPKKSDTYILP
jgi:hypothetical protein